MKIILLRVFISSWLIPFIWAICFPIAYFLFGETQAIKMIKAFMTTIWYGETNE